MAGRSSSKSTKEDGRRAGRRAEHAVGGVARGVEEGRVDRRRDHDSTALGEARGVVEAADEARMKTEPSLGRVVGAPRSAHAVRDGRLELGRRGRVAERARRRATFDIAANRGRPAPDRTPARPAVRERTAPRRGRPPRRRKRSTRRRRRRGVSSSCLVALSSRHAALSSCSGGVARRRPRDAALTTGRRGRMWTRGSPCRRPTWGARPGRSASI
mmetsp:Transcript_19866/g.79195  ORF Transcript_19866/g.79195 Transcript_19866/m.79195 type:complete len:215 (-) Transcript_19866:110-754(-)